MPGPIPNRSDDLSRPRERRGGDYKDNPVTFGEMKAVVVPEPDPAWDPMALKMWDGMVSSGQSDFYQNGDWAFAWMLCEELSIYKTREWADGEKKRSPEMLKALLSGFATLMVSEGDRRRLRLELKPPEQGQNLATLHVMDGYKNDLGLSDPDEDEDEATQEPT